MEQPDLEVAEEWKQQPGPTPSQSPPSPTASPRSPLVSAAPVAPTKRKKDGPVGQSVMHMSTLHRAPKYSFRGVKDRFQTRGLQAAAQIPGPGAYGAGAMPQVLSSRHRKSPGYRFGTSAKQEELEIRAPGPGTYPRAFRGSMGAGRAFTLTPRRWPGPPPDAGSHLLAPGPGAHDVEVSGGGPSFSILARRTPQKDGALAPGPAEYGTMDRALGQIWPKLPSWGFGTTKRPGQILEDRPMPRLKGKGTSWTQMPGPGAYNTPSTVGEGPKYSVGAGRTSARRISSPGPGDTGGLYTTFE